MKTNRAAFLAGLASLFLMGSFVSAQEARCPVQLSSSRFCTMDEDFSHPGYSKVTIHLQNPQTGEVIAEKLMAPLLSREEALTLLKASACN